MLKDRKWYVTVGLILACIIINFVGKEAGGRLELPLWLDSLGTITAACTLGPVCGAFVGLSVNVIYGILYSYTYMVYGIVSIVIGLIAGVCAKKGWFDSMFGALSTGFLITIASVIISVPCNYIFFGGRVTNTWGSGVIVMLEGIGANKLMSHIIGEFYVDFLDKVLLCIIVYLFVRLSGRRKNPGGEARETNVMRLPVTLAGVAAAALICAVIIAHAINSGGGADSTDDSMADAEVVEGGTPQDEDAEEPDFDRYVHTVYDGTNGLAGGTANAVAQTEDGILWIGTYGGLYRYNGTQFSLMEDYASVKNVNCLYTDSEGRLWIGTNDNGLSVCDDGDIEYVLDESDGLGADSVRCITRDASGSYYVGTTGSLTIVSAGEDMHVQSTVDEIVYATGVSADGQGHVAVVTDEGSLYILKDGEILSDCTPEGEDIYESCMFSTDGDLYAGTSDGILYVYEVADDGLDKRDSIRCGTLSNIKSVTEEGQLIYLCADNGAGYIDGYGVYHRINMSTFNRSLENMLIDYQGNYWFTSSRLGLMRMCPSVFTDINSEYGMAEDVVNTTAYWNGLLYIGLDDGLAALDMSGRHKGDAELTKALSGTRVRDLMTDSEGNMWIATAGMGIYRADRDGGITIFDETRGTNGSKFRSVIELSDGTIAASGDSGVTYISGDKVTCTVGYEDGLENSKILCLLEETSDTEECVLAGSDGAGIYKLKDGEVIGHFDKEDGLSSNIILRIVRLKSMEGLLIVTGNGLCYMDAGENITAIENFPYYNNYDIVEREDGMLFVLSSAGIYVVDSRELLEDGELPVTLIDSKAGFEHGLTPNSWNYTDDSGNLYMSTDSGVVMMNLNHYETSTRSYRMYVKSIIVDGEGRSVSRDEQTIIPRGASRVEIVPEVVNYSSNDPYVSIWLEGFDDEPEVMRQSEMSDIVYTNLRTNTYVFHLAVTDSTGENVIAETSYVIRKEKELYDYWWFRVYVVFVLALAMFYLAWLLIRTQIQRTIFMQKKELELARNQVAMGNETVITIARTVDARDGNTSQHSSRVSEYSVMIARRLGFTQQQCELLRKTALLHDIGKIGIPDSVLNKPGRLTDEEYEIMKTHVVKGVEILKNFSLVENVEEGVLYHHERYDGKGYVHGLKGEEIPLNARIIGIADAFDAMTANRVYRKKLDFDIVLDELRKGRGTQFDPKLTDIMLSLIEDGEIDIERLYGDSEQ